MTGSGRIPTIGRVLNLVVPGGGLILVGCETLGVLVALLFTASMCYAIAAWLLFPDDTTGAWRSLILGIALGTYAGAQIRYAQTVRHQREVQLESTRRSALHDTQSALIDGRYEDAWAALHPLANQAGSDLAVAYRMAQILTARGQHAEARRAWRNLKAVDRHRIYSVETAAAERALDEAGEPNRGG